MNAIIRANAVRYLQRAVTERLRGELVRVERGWWINTPRGWFPKQEVALPSFIRATALECAMGQPEATHQVADELEHLYWFEQFIKPLRDKLRMDRLPHPAPVTLPAEPPAQPTVSLPSQ